MNENTDNDKDDGVPGAAKPDPVVKPKPPVARRTLEDEYTDKPESLLLLRCVYEEAPDGALILCPDAEDVAMVNQWCWQDRNTPKEKRVEPVHREHETIPKWRVKRFR